MKPECRKCGECCRLKVKLGPHCVPLDSFCPGLDLETRLCRIYDERWKAGMLWGEGCYQIGDAVKHGEVPPDCEHWKGRAHWRPDLLEKVPMEIRVSRKIWADGMRKRVLGNVT